MVRTTIKDMNMAQACKALRELEDEWKASVRRGIGRAFGLRQAAYFRARKKYEARIAELRGAR